MPTEPQFAHRLMKLTHITFKIGTTTITNVWQNIKHQVISLYFMSVVECWILWAGKSYWRGRRVSTVDLLVLTSLDKLLVKLKILFTFLTKDATLMRRSTVLILPPQLVFPAVGIIGSWSLNCLFFAIHLINDWCTYAVNSPIFNTYFHEQQGGRKIGEQLAQFFEK